MACRLRTAVLSLRARAVLASWPCGPVAGEAQRVDVSQRKQRRNRQKEKNTLFLSRSLSVSPSSLPLCLFPPSLSLCAALRHTGQRLLDNPRPSSYADSLDLVSPLAHFLSLPSSHRCSSLLCLCAHSVCLSVTHTHTHACRHTHMHTHTHTLRLSLSSPLRCPAAAASYHGAAIAAADK